MSKYLMSDPVVLNACNVIKCVKRRIDLRNVVVDGFVRNINENSNPSISDYISRYIKAEINQKIEFSICKDSELGKENFARLINKLGDLEFLKNYYSRFPQFEFIAYCEGSIKEIKIELVKRKGTVFVDKILDCNVELSINPTFITCPIFIDATIDNDVTYDLQLVVFNHVLARKSAHFGICDLSIVYDEVSNNNPSI